MSIHKEPIAIIGIGCRFPGGASNPRLFWRNLCQGKDAIVDIPADRWDIRKFYDPNPNKPGKSYVKQGGFLKEKIDEFDPLFFGISPREAETMDPQQRLLLEVTWEAFEDAGLVIEELAGSNTGVFIGGFCLDNLIMRVGPLNRELADTHTAASSTMTILSNRISHIFDLTGPSVSMDTACSSSLVTTHYACQSIWNGDAEMAIAGGVNIMLRPEFPIAMSKGHFLSEHGRCMAFDVRAGGYTRGEGAGVVILKSLSTAIEHQNQIYALIKMTGVNQDGHTPGISMPNAEAQAKLMRSVYQKAGIKPGEIGYIEAHGTGTQAGDPKEAQALNEVLAEGRGNGRKCLIGSVKTNIGHLEAGAGIAGLIKAALCVQHGKIPPSLHFEKPNPNIPFESMCIEVATRVEDWPEDYRIRYAGVNAFGYGGTNAHVLLQEPPTTTNRVKTLHITWDKPCLLPVTARSESALAALAGKYAFYLTNLNDPKQLADFFFTVTKRRSHHRYRLALIAENIDDSREKLQRFSNGDYVEGLITGEYDQQQRAGLVFIYTGMGPQWWGMGRELMASEPVFMEAIRECDRFFVKIAGWSILAALQADEQSSRMAKTAVAQPANFAIQIALTALWENWGIKPDAVIGHSVGEVASAYISGALSLEDAIKVSFHRSRLQATTAGMGTMLAAGLQEQTAIALLADFDRVSVAAINSPTSVTLSGEETQLRTIAGKLQQMNIFNRFLEVETAYHSKQMEPIKNELLEVLDSLHPNSTQIPLYSTVSGKLINGIETGPDYWWRNVREPVRFAQGIQSLLQAGFREFLEIGPHPVLGHSVKEIAAKEHTKVTLIPSLKRKKPEQLLMLESLGQLYVSGYAIDWPKLTPQGGQFIRIPNYPWQKERYWNESSDSIQDRLGQSGHIFLNTRISSPQPTWTVEINEQYFPFLSDHRVHGEIVFPGAGYIEAGLALFSQVTEQQPMVIADVDLHNILLIQPEKVQLLACVYDDNNKRFLVYSRIKEDESEWNLHASGRLIPGVKVKNNLNINISSLYKRFNRKYSCEDLYAMLSKRHLDYGPNFQNAKQLWISENEFLVRIDAGDSVNQTDGSYLFHPVILDTAFHSLLSLVPGNSPFVPVSIERVVLYKQFKNPCICHGIIIEQTSTTLSADFYFYDESGNAFAEIKNCFSRVLDYALNNSRTASESHFYEPVWTETNILKMDTEIQQCLVFCDGSHLSEILTAGLDRDNYFYCKVTNGEKYNKISSNHIEIHGESETDYAALAVDIDLNQVSHLIYLWPLSAEVDASNAESITKTSMKLLYLIKAIATIEKEIILIIVTSGAQVVTAQESRIYLCNAPLWGLGPLISNEYPHIHYRLIDMDPDRDTGNISSLLFNDISDLAVRGDKIYFKQLIKTSLVKDNTIVSRKNITTDNPVMLEQIKPGQVDSLRYVQTERLHPSDNDVEIKVDYTALNFKDVLKVYNSIPEKVTNQSYFGTSVGIEIVGKIIRVGSGVNNYHVGDEVIAAAKGSFRSYATVPTKYVWPKPQSLKPEESLFYVAFSTAYYALIDIARLRAGEKVLIHSAAGALGLAAVQIAQWIGAIIFATAGSEEKREYLKSLGIAHVMDSRSMAFVDEIRSITNGQGIDVVINALSGELLRQSFNLMAPYGRFIEIGKTDIIENKGLPMAAFNQNLSFSSVDFDRMHLDRPQEVDRLVRTVLQGFDAGYFKPLPVKIYAASEVADAFRYMAQAKHIGKVVVKFDSETVEASAGKNSNRIYNPDGTYLIAGGTSGFGLEVAKWLGKKSIRRLVLISRKGMASDECKVALASLQEKGIAVEVLAVDVTNHDSVATLTKRIQYEGPPLRGIFNSAMVLDDAYIKDMNAKRFYNVLSPKVTGTMHLYRCTKDINLDFFVSFSSISSLVGNSGQANYVAANCFLDEFARFARTNGFPAISINWGVLAESGVVARNTELYKILEQEGMKGLSNQEALEAMDRIIAVGNPQTGVFNIDWAQWGKMNPRGAKSSRFQSLINSATQADNSGVSAKAQEIIDNIKNKSKEEQSEYIANNLRSGMSKILKLAPDKIKLDQHMNKLGIDSLMLLELSLAIRDGVGIDISAMELFKQPTIQQLTDEIIRRLLALKDKHTSV